MINLQSIDGEIQIRSGIAPNAHPQIPSWRRDFPLFGPDSAYPLGHLPLARGEVSAAADYLDFTAEWSRRYEGEILQSDRHGENIFMFTMPLGVVAGILPWNYPLFLLVRKLAPALLTGNTIVIKPSEETPINACIVGKLAQEVGIPRGMVNILPGGRDVGEAICQHPDVRLISLTGSVETGKRIMAAASTHVARVSLELGGKAPCIVMDDADTFPG